MDWWLGASSTRVKLFDLPSRDCEDISSVRWQGRRCKTDGMENQREGTAKTEASCETQIFVRLIRTQLRSHFHCCMVSSPGRIWRR